MPLTHVPTGDWTCNLGMIWSLTGNQIHDPWILRTTLQPSHSSQGTVGFFHITTSRKTGGPSLLVIMPILPRITPPVTIHWLPASNFNVISLDSLCLEICQFHPGSPICWCRSVCRTPFLFLAVESEATSHFHFWLILQAFLFFLIYRESVRVAMANVAQPSIGKPTGSRWHTGARPTGQHSHGKPGLHYI